MLTRRLLLAATGAALFPRRLWAQSVLDLGGLRIDTLSDGHLLLPGDFVLGGMPAEEAAAIVARHGLQPAAFEAPCNITLLRDGANTVLFDVGAGPDFQPSAGRLAEALAALGLEAGEVTHVVFTHAHPDHLWGVLDEFDEPLFPAATYAIGRAEFDYWSDPATVAAIGEARATFAVGAARRLEALAGGLALLEDGAEVLPGVAARLTPGHTPGHMSFQVTGAGGRALVLGDAVGNHHVALARPDWPSPSDQDPAQAAATRSTLLAALAASGDPVVGYHLPQGGLGRIEPEGTGYRFAALAG